VKPEAFEQALLQFANQSGFSKDQTHVKHEGLLKKLERTTPPAFDSEITKKIEFKIFFPSPRFVKKK